MSSFLDSTGLSHLIEKIKAAFISKADTTPATTISIDSTPTANSTNLVTSGGVKAAIPTKVSDLTQDVNYAGSSSVGGAANKAASIPFGVCDSTSTATAYTATVPGITALGDGTCMLLKNGVVTSTTNFTIDINGLGAKPVYSNQGTGYSTTNPTRESTLFGINNTYLFVYSSTIVSDGGWILYRGYNSDYIGSNIVESYIASRKVKTACQRYQMLLTCFDNYLLPVYSGTYTTGTNKTLTTEKFNPLGQVYFYGATTNLSANDIPAGGTLYSQYTSFLIELRYSFNTGSTLTAGNSIYLVCAPQSDGSAVLHSSPIAFALPNSEDGLIYKRLGRAYDTYRIILEQDKPVYYYKNGAIRLWTNSSNFDYAANIALTTSANYISEPEVKSIKINGSTTNSASTENAQIVYDSTDKCIKFVFN